MARPISMSLLAIALAAGCQQSAANRSPYAQPSSPYPNGMYGYGPVVGSPMFVTMPQSPGGPQGGMTPLGMAPQPNQPAAPYGAFAASSVPSQAPNMIPGRGMMPGQTMSPPPGAMPAQMMPAQMMSQPVRSSLPPASAAPATYAATAPQGPTSFWPPQGGSHGVMTYPTPAQQSAPTVANPVASYSAYPSTMVPPAVQENVPTPAVRPSVMAQLPSPSAVPAYQPYTGMPTPATTSR